MTKTINGKVCGIYQRNGHKIWVANTGDFAAVCTKNNSVGKELPIVHDFNYNFVLLKDGTMLNIVNAVITNFGPSYPNDGNEYVINHKDGDLLNCNASNLEWVLQKYEHTTDESIDLRYCGSIITVFKDGHVEQDGKPMKIYDSMDSEDLDLEVCIGPHIYLPDPHSIYHKSFFIDQLMSVAGYVQGDDSVLRFPSILHIDNDMTNCAADNLLWVEQDDPRMKKYESCMKQYKHKRNVELNPNKKLPSDL